LSQLVALFIASISNWLENGLCRKAAHPNSFASFSTATEASAVMKITGELDHKWHSKLTLQFSNSIDAEYAFFALYGSILRQ
jgi:hypothetical protein